MMKTRFKVKSKSDISIRESKVQGPEKSLVEMPLPLSDPSDDLIGDAVARVLSPKKSAGAVVPESFIDASDGFSSKPSNRVTRLERDKHPTLDELDQVYNAIRQEDLGAAGDLTSVIEKKYHLSPLPKVARAHLLVAHGKPLEAWQEISKCEGQEHVAPAVPLMMIDLAKELGKPVPERAISEMLMHYPEAVESQKLKFFKEKKQGRADGAIEAIAYGDSTLLSDPEILVTASYLPRAADIASMLDMISERHSDPLLDIAAKFAAANLAFRQDDHAVSTFFDIANKTAAERSPKSHLMTPQRIYEMWSRSGLNPDWYTHHLGKSSSRMNEVFIAGPSRSGSSLVASLLATHPKFFADGGSEEIQTFLQGRIGSSALSLELFMNDAGASTRAIVRDGYMSQRLQNHAPGLRMTEGETLLYWLPVIALLFPDTPLVFTHRHAPKLLAENYMSWHPDKPGRPFSPRGVGQAIAAYDDLVRFYMDVLPNPKILVSCDAVLQNPEKERDRLLSFLEIEKDGLSPVSRRGDILHPCDSMPMATGLFRQPKLDGILEDIIGELMQGYLSSPDFVPSRASYDPLSLVSPKMRVAQKGVSGFFGRLTRNKKSVHHGLTE